ncbi:RNA-binding domain-containing protein [uncultured Slackia sp.]|uniref:RNA-binding domain-containing protein n=1 Tax=uncultured Slackia sp. TaxID=665903 RepID=UPI0025F46E08|nr:RNA-binding domain-containing protein [uncultured Slackia sp.]
MNLSELSKYQEGNRLEAKDARGGVPKSVWESISAFANTGGGVVLLGVAERRDKSLEVVGLPDASRTLEDFWNTAHNPGKLSPCVLSSDDARVEEVDGKEVVVIEVPRARRQLRPVHINGNPKTGTYRRDHAGDYLCGVDEVAAMYRDAADEPLDAAVLDDVAMDAFYGETVRTYRRSYDFHHSRSAWSKLDDEEFLCRIGAAGRGRDGELHPTKAGLLMFGEEWLIQPEFPHYFLDYRQETSPETRWQDRVTSQTAGEWSGNVFDFFQRAYEKMRQALRVPFRLDENSRRVDETPAHDALREAIANCLVNADYNGRRGVVLLWKEDGFHLSNPGGFRIPIEDAYIGGSSDPRNGTMMKMFNLVNIGERAGSGVPNMVEDWMSSGYGRPVLSERVNPERSTIFLPLSESSSDREIRPEDSWSSPSKRKKASKEAIKRFLKLNGVSKTAEIASAIGMGHSWTSELLKEMVADGDVVAQGEARARRYSANG